MRVRNFSYPLQGFDHMQIPKVSTDLEKGHFDFKAHLRPKIVKKLESKKSMNELFNGGDETMSIDDEDENSGRHREKKQEVINRPRPRRLADEFDLNPSVRNFGENDLGIINERKRKSDQHYQLPAKRIRNDWSVSLDRLPNPLTPQIIAQLVKSQNRKNRKNQKIIHDWELMPRNTRSKGRIGK